jgi:hypothetical protein
MTNLNNQIDKSLSDGSLELRENIEEIMVPEFKNQKAMFNWIWENRAAENGYKSELTGEPLYSKGHYLWYNQFLHVLGKQAYPSYKLNPDNILLGTPDEHNNQQDYDIFNEKYTKLKRQYYKEIYGREFKP